MFLHKNNSNTIIRNRIKKIQNIQLIILNLEVIVMIDKALILFSVVICAMFTFWNFIFLTKILRAIHKILNCLQR